MVQRRRRSRPNPLRGNHSSSAQSALQRDTAGGEEDYADLEELDTTMPSGEDSAEGLHPQHSRLQQVAEQAPEYSKEYRLGTVHRMLIRNIPLDEIARQFGVSVRTIQQDRAELRRRLREEASHLDVNDLIGTTMAFYDDVIGAAMRISTVVKNPLPSRLAALRTAMQGKKESIQILAGAGVFDVIKFKAAEEGGSKELAELIEIVEKTLSEQEFGEGEDTAVLSELIEEEVRLL